MSSIAITPLTDDQKTAIEHNLDALEARIAELRTEITEVRRKLGYIYRRTDNAIFYRDEEGVQHHDADTHDLMQRALRLEWDAKVIGQESLT